MTSRIPSLRILAALASLAVPAQVASAITVSHTYFYEALHLANPGAPYGYFAFTVTTPGLFNFNVYTSDEHSVPSGYEALLYDGLSADGSGLGDLVTLQTSGCGRFSNAGCAVLTNGNYTLTVAPLFNYAADARNDTYFTDLPYDVNATAEIRSDVTGEAHIVEVSTAPEPASAALVLTGLVGVAGIGARRRRKQ